jgi:hypothetical protein
MITMINISPTVDKLMETIRLLIHNVICPIANQVKPEFLEFKTGLQSVFDGLGDLKINLNNDYEIRRNVHHHHQRYQSLINKLQQIKKTTGDDSLTMKQS